MNDAKACILVTGGAGYIGSHTVMALTAAGYRVVVLDDLSTGCNTLISKNIPSVIGDACDGNLVSQIIKDYAVTAVMHFAGSIFVEESIANPLKYYSNNTETSRRLIESCVANRVTNFVFSSTAAVYGEPDQIPITEDAGLAPINPYGASKLMTERMLVDIGATGRLQFAILRYFNVAGADLEGRSGHIGHYSKHLIRVAIETAIGLRSEIPIYGDDYKTPDGTCIRDFIHVTDLADAHVLALQWLKNGQDSLILNCGYGRGASVRQVLDSVERVSGNSLNVKIVARRKGDAARLVASADRIRKVLGWKPKLDNLDTIIKSALDWEKLKRGINP